MSNFRKHYNTAEENVNTTGCKISIARRFAVHFTRNPGAFAPKLQN